MRCTFLAALSTAGAQALVCSSYFPDDQCEQYAAYSWYCGPDPNSLHYFGYCEMEANGEWGCECADSITTVTPPNVTTSPVEGHGHHGWN